MCSAVSLGVHAYWLPGIQGHPDLIEADALGVQIDFHTPPALGHPLKNRFPETFRAIGDSTFIMGPESDPVNVRTGLQQGPHGIAAVRGMGLLLSPSIM